MPKFIEPRFAGVINEERTAVGRVHLGLVYHLQIRPAHDIVAGPELTAFAWRTREQAAQLKLEHWSRLALGLIDGDE